MMEQGRENSTGDRKKNQSQKRTLGENTSLPQSSTNKIQRLSGSVAGLPSIENEDTNTHKSSKSSTSRDSINPSSSTPKKKKLKKSDNEEKSDNEVKRNRHHTLPHDKNTENPSSTKSQSTESGSPSNENKDTKSHKSSRLSTSCGSIELDSIPQNDRIEGSASQSSSAEQKSSDTITYVGPKGDPKDWTVEEVISFICNKDPRLASEAIAFRYHQIDGSAFLLLTMRILRENVEMKVGPAVKIIDLITIAIGKSQNYIHVNRK